MIIHKSVSGIEHRTSKNGLTLMELLIVIAIIALLAAAAISFINPIKQIHKSWDTKRKSDLATLKKVLEDYYNDKNHYPPGSKICYDAPSSPRTDNYGLTACSCHVCGHNPNSPSFSPYLSDLPCDPQSTGDKNYLYDFDCTNGGTSPQWYRLYTNFSDLETATSDQDSATVNCLYFQCGSDPNYGFSYGVNSPNTDLERAAQWMFCSKVGCNRCGENGLLSSCPTNPFEYCQNNSNLKFPENLCSPSQCPCSN